MEGRRTATPKPKPITNGQRIARIIGSVSGARDQLHALRQNAIDIAARCSLSLEENAAVKFLTKEQAGVLTELQTRMTTAFDKLTEYEATITEIESTLKGEK